MVFIEVIAVIATHTLSFPLFNLFVIIFPWWAGRMLCFVGFFFYDWQILTCCFLNQQTQRAYCVLILKLGGGHGSVIQMLL